MMSGRNLAYPKSDKLPYKDDERDSSFDDYSIAVESNTDTFDDTLSRYYPTTPPHGTDRKQQRHSNDVNNRIRIEEEKRREFVEQINAVYYEDEILFGDNPNKDYFRYHLENERELKGDDSILGYSTQEDIMNASKLKLESKWEQVAASNYSVDGESFAPSMISRQTPYSASAASSTSIQKSSHGKMTMNNTSKHATIVGSPLRSQPPSIGEDQIYLEELEASMAKSTQKKKQKKGRPPLPPSRTPTTLSPSTVSDERGGVDIPSVIFAMDDDNDDTRLGSVLSPAILPDHHQHQYDELGKHHYPHKHHRSGSKKSHSRDSSQEIRKNRRMIILLFVLLIILVTGFSTAFLVIFLSEGNRQQNRQENEVENNVASNPLFPNNDGSINGMPLPPISLLAPPSLSPMTTRPTNSNEVLPSLLPQTAPQIHSQAKVPSMVPSTIAPNSPESSYIPTQPVYILATPISWLPKHLMPTSTSSYPSYDSTEERPSKESDPTMAPTTSTLPPTTMFPSFLVQPNPVFEELRDNLMRIPSLNNNTAKALFDAGTPQYRALAWLAADPKLKEYPQLQRLQRYAMASLYYGTKGESWTQSDDWLSYDSDECGWFTGLGSGRITPCNSDRVLTNLDLRNNNLKGNFPFDLSLLTDLNRIHLLENELSGRIPGELGGLRSLKRLQLTRNRLSGEIPRELMKSSSLEVLGLGRNLLTGTIPENIGDLRNLNTLGLERNKLSGRIPTSLTLMSTLTLLALDNNLLSGVLDNKVWGTPKLQVVSLQNNNLNGSAVLAGFCDLDVMLSADCEEVECPCCDECCGDDSGCWDNA
mmetsp:Transcript_3901/g.5758  ORF Transcript_3901/g.5758 Transcript_3901/m.5758 type:complete len:817 (-) Transcript_3901:259-2709(-)|eukprot:CAMPEP_0202459378 /NCGR_PEP_ID=MMETSP1360-20130828/35131_1 /ASSEMBLY_ACC=CAM_ASM_000848 /TAXON_ID=515479 /ORGANISM="Licmophora paradoxa, Strain CCMP2313" /LENGTH=816 /DNA_ID=CAMNT_0049080425 /DNA_START=116 /DNA_END=2566 /DNA_ORIENTATION=-